MVKILATMIETRCHLVLLMNMNPFVGERRFLDS